MPVVVGDRTPMCRWLIPFSCRIRSNRTSTGWEPNRTGEALAVIGKDLIGDAVASEADSTWETALEAARLTRPAATQNR